MKKLKYGTGVIHTNRAQRALELRKIGASYREIARLLKVDANQVVRWVKYADAGKLSTEQVLTQG